MKKLIIGITVAAVWLAATTTFAIIGTSETAAKDSFTVLTVKEDVVKDYNTMPVFLDLAADTGIDVKWVYNTSIQYNNNTDPVGIKGIDAIYHSGFSNLKLYDYGRRGRIVAIDKYLDSMPNFKKILSSRPEIAEALKSPDGHIYSLPRIEEMGLKAYPNILYLNASWVRRLKAANNLPDGLTIEDEDLVDGGLDLTRSQFKALLGKFKDLEKDGIPLSFVSGNWQGNESEIFSSFGLAENREHKTIIDDKVTFTFTDPKWFNAVKEMNSWYNAGLIRSSAYTQSDNEFLAKGQNGRYGAFYWWEKDTVVGSHKDEYIIVKPLIDDETGKRYVGLSNEQEVEKGECVILDVCADKEGLLSYFDKFLEPKYSAQLNYGSIKSGAFLPGLVNGKLWPNDNHGDQSADDFRMKNAPYGVVYLSKEVWEKDVEMESRAKLRLENLENYVKEYTYEGATSIPNLNYTQEELTTLNVYESSLSNNVKSWYANSVTGGGTPSEDSWKTLLNTNAESIERVLEINQRAYDRYLAAIKK